MSKSDMIEGAVKRSGLAGRDAWRGVDAALETIKRELGNAHIVHIRGLGRLHLKPKRHGFLPKPFAGGSLKPIPAGSAVRLRPTRTAVASLNSERVTLNNEDKFGGNMDKKERE